MGVSWTKETISNSGTAGTSTAESLTIDSIKIDGTTIGHTDDTDLLTFASGALSIDGNLTVTGDSTLSAGNLIITGATKGIIHTNRGAVTQGTNATTAVTLNTTSGIITTYAATLAANAEVQFTLTNSTIQADSLVLVSMNDMNTDANSHILVTTNTIASGSCIINLFNCGSGTATATACHIHFLVINNS